MTTKPKADKSGSEAGTTEKGTADPSFEDSTEKRSGVKFGGSLRPSQDPGGQNRNNRYPRSSRPSRISSTPPPKKDYKSRTLREKFQSKSFAEEWEEARGTDSEEPVMDLSSEMVVEEEPKRDSRPSGVRTIKPVVLSTPPPPEPIAKEKADEEIPLDADDLIEAEEEFDNKPTVVQDLASPSEVFDSLSSPPPTPSTPVGKPATEELAVIDDGEIEEVSDDIPDSPDEIPVLDADQVEDYYEETESEANEATSDILGLVSGEPPKTGAEATDDPNEEIALDEEQLVEVTPEEAEEAEQTQELDLSDAKELDLTEATQELDLSDAEEVSEAQLPPTTSVPPEHSPSSVPPPTPSDGASPRMRRRRKPMKEWWARIFNDDYVSTIPKATVRGDQRKVNFIEKNLGLPPNSLILDLACGNGRHSVGMAKRGYRIVGIDLSLPMLAQAAELAQEEKQNINFIHGDMRDLGFNKTFDGVFCMGTSFGYFNDATNFKCLKGVARSLKPGGAFLLEVANRDNVIMKVPELTWFEGNGSVCMEESSFDFQQSRLTVNRQLIMDGGRQVQNDISIRLYSLHELREMLQRAGFTITTVSGHQATLGAFFGQDSVRILISATRNK